ncbi:SDR family NAD(P)-dependent oxidoreductase [Actinokineospora iranica]|uniref:NAD(P)-dependent dehydrogenase, short-chain alcohol dehydrogenase family n=1 Tax=Actinokineospora iranica TaxID=1271860 RepID=A0A1G6S9F7_9PSEU|nr:SDR family oxidoreductase [Actinokineospora iranica]SDD13304.1 NAD(P)-dependent dehydrogenase, short-chain alcohol dehydrogenase family [Actinokineospora iranica]
MGSARDLAVMVTGGGKGLGLEFARALAEDGAAVLVTGRDQAALDHAVRGLRKAGGTAEAVRADVTDRKEIEHAVNHAVDAFGKLDVLVNNAGTPGPLGPTWEVDEAAWWHTFEVNVRGTLLACRAAAEVMAPSERGRIINITSHAGKHRWPHASAYSVSKGAIIKLTENLAVELKPHHVSVVSYHPGLIDAGMTHELMTAEHSDPWEEKVAEFFRHEKDEGRFTSIEQAKSTLLRLVTGEADTLSGRYVTAEDDLAELAAEKK